MALSSSERPLSNRVAGGLSGGDVLSGPFRSPSPPAGGATDVPRRWPRSRSSSPRHRGALSRTVDPCCARQRSPTRNARCDPMRPDARSCDDVPRPSSAIRFLPDAPRTGRTESAGRNEMCSEVAWKLPSRCSALTCRATSGSPTPGDRGRSARWWRRSAGRRWRRPTVARGWARPTAARCRRAIR